MKTGIMFMNTDEGYNPLELARLVDDSGIESIFVPDHSHVPVGSAVPEERKVVYGGDEKVREKRFATSPGGLPREYYRNFDQLTALAAMGAVTSNVRLATGICLVIQRDPIYLAKQVATIDQLTGGRFIFGVGAGAAWNVGEMRNHGVDTKKRTSLLLERIDAIKEIWTKERAEYHGKQVDFDPIFSWPKPFQQPHPPILMGGDVMAPTGLDRVLSHADGWYPGHVDDSFPALGDRMAELRERAAAINKSVEVSLNFGRLDSVDQYVELGLDRVVYLLSATSSPDETRQFVADVAKVAEQVRDVPSAV